MQFEEAYQNYYKELYRFGRKVLNDKDQCEDLIQDTFEKLYLEMAGKREILNTRAWLFKVLINLSYNKNKRSKNELERMQTINQDRQQGEPHTGYPENERFTIVMDVMSSLPEKERSLMILYHDGFSYAEMAEILSMNPASVGTLLARSIQKLTVKLKTTFHELFE